jgi:CubicO group peptidase (beta-lactamase class C family)
MEGYHALLTAGAPGSLLRAAAALLATCCLPVLAAAPLRASGEPPPEAAEIAREFLAHPDTGAQGISVAAFNREGIIWSGGFGLADPENGVPAGGKTRYHFASVTKVFTTLVLAQLAVEGRLAIDDPVTKLVPEFAPRYPEPGARPVTLRDLATHSAGLTNVWGRGRLTNQLSEEELLGRMRDHGLAIQPGYQSKYSNYGLSLLGLALSRAAGKPYEDLVRARVLEPLGMSASGFEELYDHPDLAVGHWFSDGVLRRQGRSGPFHAHAPASAIVSHVEDIARFGIAHLSRDPDGVAPPAVQDRLFSVHGAGGGLGWMGSPSRWYHGGAWGGHYSRLALRTDVAVGVALSTNGGPWGFDPVSRFIETLASYADTSELEAVCGVYADGAGDDARVTLSGFRLKIEGEGRLVPISRHSFVVEDERGRRGAWVRFIEEDGERVMLWETRRLVRTEDQ